MINLIWLAKQSVIHQSVTDEANSPGLLLKAGLHNETLAGRVHYLRIIRDVSLTDTSNSYLKKSLPSVRLRKQHVLTESYDS